MPLSASLPHYEVRDDELGYGASLGNGHCWINIGPDGRIQSLFNTDVGEEVAGPLILRYASPETRLAECRGAVCRIWANVPLSPALGSGILPKREMAAAVEIVLGDVFVTSLPKRYGAARSWRSYNGKAVHQ
jgi:hypothetical protein